MYTHFKPNLTKENILHYSTIILISALLCSTIFFRAAIEHIRYSFIAIIILSIYSNKILAKKILTNTHLHTLAIFFLISVLSLIANNQSISLVDEILNWILVFGAGYISSYHLEKNRDNVFVLIPITILTIFIIVPILLGDGFQYLDFSEKRRLQIFFTQRANHLGLICSISFFISLYFALVKTNIFDRIFFTFLGIISFMVLIKTGARTSFLATILVCFLLVLWNFKKSAKLLLLTVIIFACGILAFTQTDILKNNRITNITKGIKNDKSFQQRKLTWTIAFDTFKANPIIGSGFDTFEEQFKKGRKFYASKSDFSEKFPYTIGNTNHAHNFSLHFLAETGIIGFIAMTFFWFSVICKGVLKQSHTTRIVAGIFLISYLAFQLNMSLYGSQLSTLLFSFAGISSYVIDER